MISKVEFEEYLNQVDTSDYDERMSKQQKKGTIFSVCCFSILAVLVVAIIILGLCHLYWCFVFMPVCILAISFGCAGKSLFTSKVYKDFDDKYRNQFMTKLLEGYNYHYSRNHYIAEHIYSRIGFTSTGDHYVGQDLLEIEIPNKDGGSSGAWLRICDLHITETHIYRDSDGTTHTETETLFAGAFGYVAFKEEFKCAIGIDAIPRVGGTKRIKLEDIEFNKQFRLHTTDQLEALRILTPDMMQKLLNLNKAVKRLEVLLQHNALSIGFAKDLFEPTRKDKKTIAEKYMPLYDDVAILVKIVEEIRRNKKVFKI